MRTTQLTHTPARARQATLSGTEIALVMLVLAVLVAAAWISGGVTTPDVPTIKVRVQQGDTLWSLAERYPVPGRTTEHTAELLARLNRLDDPTIVAGTSLHVPAESLDGRSDDVALR